MTIIELSKYHLIKIEIEQLDNIIKDFEATLLSSSKMKEVISSSNNNSNPTEKLALKFSQLKDELILKKRKLTDENIKIESFLATVDDAEIRIIIRKRFLEGKTWQVISEELNMDRTTPYYKLNKYLEEVSKKDENRKNHKII
jgi:hypothetical protein